MFEKWVAIEKDDSVCAELRLEEEAEIRQQILSKNSDRVDVNHEEEDDENDETVEKATPSSTEMKLLLNRLQIDLKWRGFNHFISLKR